MKYFQAVLFPDSHSLSHVVLTWPGFIPCPAAGLSIPCSHPFSCSQHLGCAGLPCLSLTQAASRGFHPPGALAALPASPAEVFALPAPGRDVWISWHSWILHRPPHPRLLLNPRVTLKPFQPFLMDLLFLSVAAESFWFDFATWWEKPEHPNSSTGRSLAQSSWI